MLLPEPLFIAYIPAGLKDILRGRCENRPPDATKLPPMALARQSDN
jgi:hypothetical protein